MNLCCVPVQLQKQTHHSRCKAPGSCTSAKQRRKICYNFIVPFIFLRLDKSPVCLLISASVQKKKKIQRQPKGQKIKRSLQVSDMCPSKWRWPGVAAALRQSRAATSWPVIAAVLQRQSVATKRQNCKRSRPPVTSLGTGAAGKQSVTYCGNVNE